MNYFYSKLASAFLVFLLISPLQVNAQEVYQVNTITQSSVQEQAKTIDGVQQERLYFQLNTEIFDNRLLNRGDLIELQVSETDLRQMEITRVSEFVPGIRSYIARDQQGASLSFTYNDGRILGLMHKEDHSSFHFEYDAETENNFITANSSHGSELACGVHEDLEVPRPHTPQTNGLKLNTSDESQKASINHGHIPTYQASQSLKDDVITIDILIPYTENAKNWAESSSGFGTIDAVIGQALNLSQEALDNSLTGIELRLVHFYETDYTDDGFNNEIDAADHLRRLTQNPANPLFEPEYNGYMEEVHDLRDEYGADLVALFASEPNTGGIAWLLSNIRGRQDIGFSVNRIQQLTNGYTLVHEIGHNMGSAHARNQPSAPAGVTGGLFEFSTGLRYTGDSSSNATVMAYTDGTFSRIPYFSSMEAEFDGRVTGSDVRTDGGPSDSVRSFKKIKRAIAGYRNTVVDPPIMVIETDDIFVNLNREDEAEFSFDISNTGLSDLVWDVEFSFVEGVQTASAKTASTGNRAEHRELSFDESIHHELNNPAFTSVNRGVVYETDFSQDDGFTTGTRSAMESWTTWNAATGNFNISTENALTGGQHMRAEYESGIQNNIIVSPYWGPQIFSKYELSMSFYLPDNQPTRDGRFDIYFYDFSTPHITEGGSASGGFLLLDEQLYAMDLNEQGGSSFFSSADIEYGQYHDLKVVYNTDNQTVDYYLDDTLIRESGYYPAGGFRPDQIWVWSQASNASGSYMDVDNLKVERTGTPTSWLDIDRFGGVAPEGGLSELTLMFNTIGIDAGTYEIILHIRSNDTENPVHDIPVTLEVNETVSLEGNDERPAKTRLAQNYPNPFNPTTQINYTLANSGHVSLSVYDMIGRKVATLVNEQMPSGDHQVQFDASNLSSGVYIYRLQTGSEMLTRQMVLIK